MKSFGEYKDYIEVYSNCNEKLFEGSPFIFSEIEEEGFLTLNFKNKLYTLHELEGYVLGVAERSYFLIKNSDFENICLALFLKPQDFQLRQSNAYLFFEIYFGSSKEWDVYSEKNILKNTLTQYKLKFKEVLSSVLPILFISSDETELSLKYECKNEIIYLENFLI
ncbi:MAG: hypothetical protein ACK5LM_00090 [Lactovum sp.]